MISENPLIITDLDGTLLDHYTYTQVPVAGLLHLLAEKKIPVIPNTSKTRAEIIELQGSMPGDDPFIVENGAAVYLPKNTFSAKQEGFRERGNYWCMEFARPRDHWLEVLDQLPVSMAESFESFSAMTSAKIVEITGLSEGDARRARQREYGEPIQWLGNAAEKAAFCSALENLGGTVLQGGRFLHLGDKVNKGKAMQWLKHCYERCFPEKIFTTIALGDSLNDIDMLECADYAVVVGSPAHPPPQLQRTKNVLRVTEQGPAGWNKAVRQLLGLNI